MSDKLNPFIRWAGGKTKLVTEIKNFVPDDYIDRTYREPFLGGGSLFYSLLPSKGVLSDININLINCYKKIQENPYKVYDEIRKLVKVNSEKQYYLTRDKFNRSNPNTYTQAARFIYLNKTCFNGLYRVNRSGEFNVPYGYIDVPSILTLEDFIKHSEALGNMRILDNPFDDALKNARKGNFIYLDPPYPPLNKTSYFNHYTKDRFDSNQQTRLSQIANKLKDKKCLILISNADTLEIRNLYKKWKITELQVTRWINSNSNRIKAKELIITNY